MLRMRSDFNALYFLLLLGVHVVGRLGVQSGLGFNLAWVRSVRDASCPCIRTMCPTPLSPLTSLCSCRPCSSQRARSRPTPLTSPPLMSLWSSPRCSSQPASTCRP